MIVKRIFVVLAISVLANSLAARSGRVAAGEASDSVQPVQGSRQAELAIIVNKANPIESVSSSELREYFLAERTRWSSGGRKVRIVMRQVGQPERKAVLDLIYRMNEKSFTTYFLAKKFTGEVLEEPTQQASALDVIRVISDVAGAIGYVRADERDASVKMLRVDGVLPGEPGYKIKF